MDKLSTFCFKIKGFNGRYLLEYAGMKVIFKRMQGDS